MGRLFIILLVIVGLLVVAVRVVKAGSSPSFLPGHVDDSTAHRRKHGLVAVVMGAGVLVIAGVLGAQGRQR